MSRCRCLLCTPLHQAGCPTRIRITCRRVKCSYETKRPHPARPPRTTHTFLFIPIFCFFQCRTFVIDRPSLRCIGRVQHGGDPNGCRERLRAGGVVETVTKGVSGVLYGYALTCCQLCRKDTRTHEHACRCFFFQRDGVSVANYWCRMCFLLCVARPVQASSRAAPQPSFPAAFCSSSSSSCRCFFFNVSVGCPRLAVALRAFFSPPLLGHH